MSTDLSKLRGWREFPMKIVVFRIDSQLSPVFSFWNIFPACGKLAKIHLQGITS